MSSEQVDALQKVLVDFRAARPANHQQCVACGSMRWEEHYTAEGDACWACAGCHRPPSLTAEAWHAESTRERQAAEARRAAAAASTPDPRVVLRERLGALSEARNALEKLERAVPIARSAASEAQSRHDAAVSAAEAVTATAAENLAASFFEGSRPADPARVAAAARGELAAATDGLVATKNAKTILDGKVTDARNAVGYASDRARKAARGVIAAERLEDLLAEATGARAAYLESVGQLGWLLRNHAIPNGDARPHQILADANTPPSRWREAATAGDPAMESMLAALLADPEAATK